METTDNLCHCNCGWAGPAGDLPHVRYEEVAPGEIMPLGMCPDCRKKILPASAIKPPRVTITIEGGLINAVESDEPVDVIAIDYDIDGEEAKHLCIIGGNEARVRSFALRTGSGLSKWNTARIFREYHEGMQL